MREFGGGSDRAAIATGGIRTMVDANRCWSSGVGSLFGGACLVLAFGLVGCDGGSEGEPDVVVIEDDGGGGLEADTTVDGRSGDAVGTDADADPAASCDPGETYNDERGVCLCGGEVCDEHAECDTETGLCVTKAEERCTTGGSWSEGEEAFVDASDEWNLAEIAPTGVRLSVTDFDGDGWPDLAVREVGGDPNDFSDGGRTVWLLRNTGDGGFEDVTESSGFLKRRSQDSGDNGDGRPAEVVVWGDVDNDGDLDAYTGFNRPSPEGDGAPTAEIMLNEGDGTFELAPSENDVRRVGTADMPAGATFVDYDRDGNLDLWVTQYGTNSTIAMRDQLYRGRGDGTFERVTSEVGIDSVRWGLASIDDLNQAQGNSRSWGSNACDLDGDGRPELLASSYGRAPNHLWRAPASEGDTIAYENVSVDSGYAYDDGMDWTDNEFARCYCKLNPEAEGCDGVPPPAIRCESSEDVRVWRHSGDREPYRLGGNTGTTLCADLDRDGRFDLVTNEIRHWWAGSSSDPSEILYNRGEDEIRFERPGREETGLTREHASQTWDEGDITGGIFDFDNDGRLDIYIGSTDYPGTRGLLYRQVSDANFEPVDPSDGIDHRSSHGIALADFDRDGDTDVAVGHSRTRCSSGNHCYPEEDAHVRLFENTAGDRQNWLQLKLVGGDGTNRSAIGARVTVETESGTQTKEVGGGHGHYGIQHDLTQQFGLGDECRATVTVRWPDASLSTQTFVLKAGHRYRLVQGGSPLVAEH